MKYSLLTASARRYGADMSTQTELWRFLLATPNWQAQESDSAQGNRIGAISDSRVKVSAEMDKSIPPGRYLPIECADGRIDWAKVHKRYYRADGAVTLHLEPLNPSGLEE